VEDRVVISCPHCSERYKIRREIVGRSARCSKCRKVFALIIPKSLDEDEILSLVSGGRVGEEDEEEAKNATVAGLSVVEGGQEREFAHQTAASASGAGKTPSPDFGAPLKLLTIDGEGVHLRFSAELLKSEQFRASFPKKCAVCLSKHSLQVFLLRWPESKKQVEGFGTKKTIFPVSTLAELPQVDTVELLQYLPIDNKLAEPFSRPFPYYVCARCRGEAQSAMEGTYDPENGHCLLRIANFDLAFRFYTANCGTETVDYHKLLSHTKLCKRSHWDALPDQDRKRISEWFKPLDKERFVSYVPDMDTPSVKKGETGIVVTNQRMVCAKNPGFRQFPFSEHITVFCHPAGEAMKVDISSASQGRIAFRLNDSAWVNLKNSLQDLKVSVRFVEV